MRPTPCGPGSGSSSPAALLAAVALGVREALEPSLSDSLLDQTMLVLVASAAGLAAYTAVVFAARVEEAQQIAALVRSQFARLAGRPKRRAYP